MIHKMSPSDFSTLVSESIAASGPEMEFGQKVTPDKVPASADANAEDDIFDIDDNLDGIMDESPADSLDDFEMSDDLDDYEREESAQAASDIRMNHETAEQCFLPDFLSYKTLESESSKIPDYTIDLKIESQEKETVEPTSLFETLLQKFELSFMLTDECCSFCDLWNKNFIISQTDSDDVAFERLLAMFYHIRCQTRHTVTRIREADNAELVKKLSRLGRVIGVRDVELVLNGHKEPQQSADTISGTPTEMPINTPESQELTETPELTGELVSAVDDTASENCMAKVPEEVAETPKPVRLTKQKRLKLFAEHVFNVLLSDNARSHILKIKSIKNCYDNLYNLFISGKLEQEQFVKFALFLSKTREIVLDIGLVEQTGSFNAYFASLLCSSAKHKYVEDDYYDTMIMTGPRKDNVSLVFMSYVAFNWRMLQQMTNSKSDVNSAKINNKRAMIFRIDRTVALPKLHFQKLKSPLSCMAADFTRIADNAILDFTQPECNFTSDDLDFYTIKRNSLQVPAAYRTYSSQQIEALSIVMSYIESYQKDVMRLVASGLLPNVADVRVWFLSSTGAYALYQILAYCLSRERNVNVSLKYQKIEEPKVVLSGSGMPSCGITLTPTQFSDYCRLVIEHINMSSSTNIFIENGSLFIRFNK